MDEQYTGVSKKTYWKKYVPIAVAGLVGLILLICGGSLGNTGRAEETTDAQAYFSVRFYTEDLEERIEELCRQVHGVGEVHVLLTLEGGSEYVYAANISGGAHSYLLTAEGERETPVLVQEIYPRIRGIAVVCSRGDDSTVRLAITELLSAAFGIPTSRICVVGT